MTARPTRTVLGLIAFGVLVRLILAATTDGNTFDLNSYGLVDAALRTGDRFELYGDELYFAPLDVYRWPYPPGFMPVILVASELAQLTGIAFERLIRLPLVAADAAIAWVVFTALRRAHDDKLAVAGAAAVALGPSFIAVSGYHGQVEPLAFLPVVLAVALWQKPGFANRALVCGLLVGVGAALKAPAGFIVLALLANARTPREAVTVVAAAVAVPVLLLAPFLLSDFGGVRDSLAYGGLPGTGGLSLLAQPELATSWLGGIPHARSGLTDALQDLNRMLVLAGLAAVTVVLVKRRIGAATGAAAIVLVVWICGANFGVHYAVWGLPFLLLAGHVRAAVGLQALLFVPTVMIYTIKTVDGWSNGLVYGVYVPLMLATLASWVLGLVWLLRRPQPA